MQWVKLEGDGARNEKGSSTSTAWLVVSPSVFLGQVGTLDSNSTHIQLFGCKSELSHWLQVGSERQQINYCGSSAQTQACVLLLCRQAGWAEAVPAWLTPITFYSVVVCSHTLCPGSGRHSYLPASAALHMPSLCLSLQREADDQCWGSYWADPVITCVPEDGSC